MENIPARRQGSADMLRQIVKNLNKYKDEWKNCIIFKYFLFDIIPNLLFDLTGIVSGLKKMPVYKNPFAHF